MITVRYKCVCMQDEGAFEAPARQPDEDVVDWVKGPMAWALALDHRQRSPACRSDKVEYVKIPTPENAAGLGMQPKLDT